VPPAGPSADPAKLCLAGTGPRPTVSRVAPVPGVLAPRTGRRGALGARRFRQPDQADVVSQPGRLFPTHLRPPLRSRPPRGKLIPNVLDPRNRRNAAMATDAAVMDK